jgi:ubiquinone/menaquinone biosynthesis C-methylase UbiE
MSQKNQTFWNELCGTRAFKNLGLNEVNPTSIKKFDEWYMDYYPYLYDYIHFDSLSDKKVLEIGLGFGTVGEKLFKKAKLYTGLDYAEGPVAMMNQRISWNNIQDSASAQQGDARKLPFEDNTFDVVVSIGCLHHTGDTKKSIEEVHRVLSHGGQAVIMLYYKGSYMYKLIPLLYAYKKAMGRTKMDFDTFVKSVYDNNMDGDAAPIVDFVTKTDIKEYFRSFSKLNYSFENSFKFLRPVLMHTIAKIAGKDVYIQAIK